MSTRKPPQGRNLTDLIANAAMARKFQKSVEKLVVPVMPRGSFKFDPLDFWIEVFMLASSQGLDQGGTSQSIAKWAGEYADSALNVAEERWGKQRVK